MGDSLAEIEVPQSADQMGISNVSLAGNGALSIAHAAPAGARPGTGIEPPFTSYWFYREWHIDHLTDKRMRDVTHRDCRCRA
jgi:hypothetical protein